MAPHHAYKKIVNITFLGSLEGPAEKLMTRSVMFIFIRSLILPLCKLISNEWGREKVGLQLLYHLQKCICNLIGQSKGQPIRIDILPGSFLATRYQRMMFLLFLRYIENVGHLKIVKCHVCNCNTNYLNRCRSKVI